MRATKEDLSKMKPQRAAEYQYAEGDDTNPYLLGTSEYHLFDTFLEQLYLEAEYKDKYRE
jgi:hypothetical protein